MKRIFEFVRSAGIALACCWLPGACEPINTPDQMAYVAAKDIDGHLLSQLRFSATGGTQIIYVETTLPRWMARPTSLNNIPYVHPVPDDEGYVVTSNLDGWMSLRYRHLPGGDGAPVWLDLFNGEIEVTVTPNTGAVRTDGIYIWNDDIPANLLKNVTVEVNQSEE